MIAKPSLPSVSIADPVFIMARHPNRPFAFRQRSLPASRVPALVPAPKYSEGRTVSDATILYFRALHPSPANLYNRIRGETRNLFAAEAVHESGSGFDHHLRGHVLSRHPRRVP